MCDKNNLCRYVQTSSKLTIQQRPVCTCIWQEFACAEPTMATCNTFHQNSTTQASTSSAKGETSLTKALLRKCKIRWLSTSELTLSFTSESKCSIKKYASKCLGHFTIFFTKYVVGKRLEITFRRIFSQNFQTGKCPFKVCDLTWCSNSLVVVSLKTTSGYAPVLLS